MLPVPLALFALSGCLPSFLGSDGSTPTAEAHRGPFEVHLSVHGELDAKSSESITVPRFTTRLEIAWLADQGAVVDKGEKVVEFETRKLLEQLEEAENNLKLAETKILQEAAKLELAIADAEATIKKAELDLAVARMKITDSETVPLVEREQARVAETKAEMAIDAARDSLANVKLESRAETQLQQLEVDKNARRVDEIRDSLEKAVLTSPTDGIVIYESRWDDEFWRVGDSPWGGSTLMKLPDMGTLQVVAWVHEVDTPRVAAGQKARITLDAFPEQVVTGEIAKVADLAVARGSDQVKYLEIEVALDRLEPQFKPGMSARVDLLLERIDDALSVPIEAVFRADGQPVVYTRGLGGWSPTPVELGTENDTHVVVVSGLEAGAEVALVDPTDGDESRAAAEAVPVAATDDDAAEGGDGG
jgi:multidrug efflux pump subunit AcrA (membrane-fusion protein)